MRFMREEKDGCVLLKIEGPMTINEASVLRDEMVECFKTYKGVIIDMNAVGECDMAAIQLLYSARLTARDTGKRFEVANISMSSMDAIARAGMDPDAISRSTGEKGVCSLEWLTQKLNKKGV